MRPNKDDDVSTRHASGKTVVLYRPPLRQSMASMKKKNNNNNKVEKEVVFTMGNIQYTYRIRKRVSAIRRPPSGSSPCSYPTR